MSCENDSIIAECIVGPELPVDQTQVLAFRFQTYSLLTGFMYFVQQHAILTVHIVGAITYDQPEGIFENSTRLQLAVCCPFSFLSGFRRNLSHSQLLREIDIMGIANECKCKV